jgi:hypothetical protein
MARSKLIRRRHGAVPVRGSVTTAVTETMKEVALEGKEKVSEIAHSLTLSWHELQDWQRDNEFIHRGYRR